MIKIPMDLHMVKNKLGSDEYETFEDFFRDVKLIFTNAHEYYQVGASSGWSSLHLKRLRKIWEDDRKNILEVSGTVTSQVLDKHGIIVCST